MYPHYDPSNPAGAFTSHAMSGYDFYDRYVHFPTTMRTIPTITVYSRGSGVQGQITDIDANATISGLLIGIETNERQIYWYADNVLTQGHLYSWHFTADAEL